MPVSVGAILGFLSPLLGAFADFMVEKSGLPLSTQERILLITRIKSLLVMMPVLLLCDVTVSMLSAYFHSPYGSIQDLIDFLDYFKSISMGIIFGIALAGLAYLELKIFFRRIIMPKRIAVCVVSIVVNQIAVVLLDMGLTDLLSTMGTVLTYQSIQLDLRETNIRQRYPVAIGR